MGKFATLFESVSLDEAKKPLTHLHQEALKIVSKHADTKGDHDNGNGERHTFGANSASLKKIHHELLAAGWKHKHFEKDPDEGLAASTHYRKAGAHTTVNVTHGGNWGSGTQKGEKHDVEIHTHEAYKPSGSSSPRTFRKQNESVEQVTEALRKVGHYEAGSRKATVHRDTEWDEYRVKHHVDGKHQGEDSDYHTDDKEEALSHAKQWASGVHEATQVDEVLRKVGQHENGDRSRVATIHKDTEWGEYRVKFHKDGKHLGDEADYHTDDKEDAHDTARGFIEGRHG